MKAAVSRLGFGPETDEMQVTDIETGHLVFPPVPGEKVSYGELEGAITDAGYEIEKASIRATGTLVHDGKTHHLRIPDSGQVFHLEGAIVERLRQRVEAGAGVTVSGRWSSRKDTEIITLETASSDAPGDDE